MLLYHVPVPITTPIKATGNDSGMDFYPWECRHPGGKRIVAARMAAFLAESFQRQSGYERIGGASLGILTNLE